MQKISRKEMAIIHANFRNFSESVFIEIHSCFSEANDKRKRNNFTFQLFIIPLHNNRLELWGSLSKYYFSFFFPESSRDSPKNGISNFNVCLFLSVRTIRVLRSKGLICYILFDILFLFLSFPPFSWSERYNRSYIY